MMKRALFFIILLILWALNMFSQPEDSALLRGPYLGQKPPGKTPEIFAPGVVSTDAHEFSCCFSPDGKEFYFTRRHPEWNMPLVIFSRLVDEAWTEPQDAGASFNPAKAMHISSTRDGTIYTTDISGGPGSECLAIMKKSGEGYAPLEKLGSPLNQHKLSQHPFIAPDESYILFTVRRPGQPVDSVLFVSYRGADDAWSEPKQIDLGMSAGIPFVSGDGKYLFFTAGKPPKSDVFWVSAEIIEGIKPRK